MCQDGNHLSCTEFLHHSRRYVDPRTYRTGTTTKAAVVLDEIHPRTDDGLRLAECWRLVEQENEIPDGSPGLDPLAQ
jgi:hypothetical protein